MVEEEGAKEAVPNLIPPKAELTVDLLREYWIAKGVSVDCELCKVNSWVVTIEIDGRVPSLIARKDSDAVAGDYTLPAVLSICSNCGNVRTFVRHAVEIWRDQNMKQENASE